MEYVLTVTSRPGGGTSFVIHFPAWSEVARPSEAQVGIALARGTETIAVVEDEERCGCRPRAC